MALGQFSVNPPYRSALSTGRVIDNSSSTQPRHGHLSVLTSRLVLTEADDGEAIFA
jgi:hypothetical protein